MPYIVSGNVKPFFEENGYGYPIIFLHEFESDSRAWDSQIRHFARNYRCIAYNARGYPPSGVPNESASYGWELSVEDVAAVMRGLSSPRAHLVGSSMGGYAALQFALRYPEKASAVVAAGTGLGSLPSERQAWLKRTVALARAITARGMKAMAPKMAHHPARIQLKYKDPRGWWEYLSRLEQHSPIGMSNTLARVQGLRPSLFECSDEFSRMAMPAIQSIWKNPHTSMHNWEPSSVLSSEEAGDGLSRWLYYFRENSIADHFQSSFRTELAKGVTELGSRLADYDLGDEPTDASTPHPK